MDADAQLRNLRDFLLVYNRMTEACFQRCTTNFNYRNLTMDEERCVDNCAGKLIRSNHRLMGTYVKLMPAMVQRRMEEMESKAAEAAKAASHMEPLAGNIGTPETTGMMSSATASPTLAEVPGSVSFPSLASESPPSDLSSVRAPATGGTAAILMEPVIQTADGTTPSITSQTTNVSLTQPACSLSSELPAVTPSTQRSSEAAILPLNSSVPTKGSLSSEVAAIQSTVGTKQDKRS